MKGATACSAAAVALKAQASNNRRAGAGILVPFQTTFVLAEGTGPLGEPQETFFLDR